MKTQKLMAGLLGTTLLLAACGQTTSPATLQSQGAALSDSTTTGAAGFFLLSPVVANPNVNGDIHPGLVERLAVRVQEISADHNVVADRPAFTYTHEQGLAFLDATYNAVTGQWSNPQYQFDWNTALAALDNNRFYRVSVLLEGASLGHVDIDPAPSGTDRSKKKPTPDFVTVVNGRTLPVKFHITNADAPNGTAPAQVSLTASYQGNPTPSPVMVSDTSAVTLSVNAYDRTGVTAVDFYEDDLLVGTDSTPSDGFSYRAAFDSTQEGATHTYSVVAHDRDGNASARDTSPTVSVTVDFPEPTSVAPATDEV